VHAAGYGRRMSTDPVAAVARDGRRPLAPDATVARVTLRPIGSPLPLGAFALVPSGLLLAGLELGWFPAGQATAIPYVVLGFSVPLQIIASVLAFLGRDGLVGSSFGLFAGTWLAFSLSGLATGVTHTSRVLGVLYLAAGGIFALLMAGGFVAGKAAIGIIVIAGSGRFLLSGLYHMTGSTALERAAGIVGLVFVGLAAYAALAALLEDNGRRTILPLGRRGLARVAIDDDLGAQLGELEHEVGVRKQLGAAAAGASGVQMHPDAARAQLRAHHRIRLRGSDLVEPVEHAAAKLRLVEAVGPGLVDQRVAGGPRADRDAEPQPRAVGLGGRGV
jgi:uncharacterized protein